jgi:hypothetical protein
MSCFNVNYNPNPTRVWNRESNTCLINNINANSTFPDNFQMFKKGNVLQYPKNASHTSNTKAMQYARLAKGINKYNIKSFASQTSNHSGATNPNSHNYLRTNAIKINAPDNTPSISKCKGEKILNGGVLHPIQVPSNNNCNTNNTPTPIFNNSLVGNPTSASNVPSYPGTITKLYWNSMITGYNSRSKHKMTNTPNTFPYGYKFINNNTNQYKFNTYDIT